MMSLGSRSGVHWIRANVALTAFGERRRRRGLRQPRHALQQDVALRQHRDQQAGAESDLADHLAVVCRGEPAEAVVRPLHVGVGDRLPALGMGSTGLRRIRGRVIDGVSRRNRGRRIGLHGHVVNPLTHSATLERPAVTRMPPGRLPEPCQTTDGTKLCGLARFESS